MKKKVMFAVLAWSGSAALAGEKPIFAEPPAWVKPAPPIDVARVAKDSNGLVILDNQQLLEDGRTWSYFQSAVHAASADLLGSIGTIQLPWQPDQGDLIVHRVTILRGAERIDALKGGEKLTVIRREQALE